MKLRLGVTLLMIACALVPDVAAAQGASGSARTLYMRTLAREQALRSEGQPVTIERFRSIVTAYEAIVRRFPGSGYSDNALWQGGNLALLAFQRFGQPADRQTAERLLARLVDQYPSSSLIAGVDDALRGTAGAATPVPADPADTAAGGPASAAQKPPAADPARSEPEPGVPAASEPVLIRAIKRTALPDGMRVTVEMDAEAPFRAERLENPRRVFFDLKGTRPVPSLLDATIRFSDDIVREIRLGRHPKTTTRIVFDMEGVESYSVFTLYSPYRLVIDFKPQRATAGLANAPRAVAETFKAPPAAAPAAASAAGAKARPNIPEATESALADGEKRAVADVMKVPAATVAAPVTAAPAPRIVADPLPERAAPRLPVAPAPIPPAVPAANLNGKFSLSRQLGLGVSRIVIDAGHGGHDPGAQSNGVSESELTLDVAMRLNRLLQKQPGVEVVMTRDADVFVPLEERTAIANREGADLFLSIHANASRNPKAHGVETYFLNFASNADAAAVAARENSASARAMHSLPEIVRAIALNNKIDESRDFADIVQRSMVRRLSTRNQQLRDLGVKQAPFVVLIGATMPSVLAEISFVTHRQEGQLLKTTLYRQQIAEALFDAVLRYQQSLKKVRPGVVGMGAR